MRGNVLRREGCVNLCVIDAVHQPPSVIAYWYPPGLSIHRIIYGSCGVRGSGWTEESYIWPGGIEGLKKKN